MGLRLAREANDADSVGWAASGILQRAWHPGYELLHREADETARDMEAYLRKAGNDDDADRLARVVAEALQRDLVIELSWSGKADLDLLVEEPSGAVCSVDNPATTGGGIFTHDGYGADQRDAHDNYVCPRGMSGDYRVTVRHISGDVVSKRAVLKIVRYQGSPGEIEERFTIKVADHDKVVRVTLTNGRLKALSAVQLLDLPRDPAGDRRGNRRERLVRNGREGQRAGARFVADRQIGGGPGGPGYNPVITVIPEGVMMSALAVISGDRRYIRLTMAPVFSALTDVQTFSFITSPGGQVNNAGQGGGAGGAGGGGVGGGVQ
jgi:hypothetical protein